MNKEIVQKALEALNIDERGLDKNDRKTLEILIEKFNGGPVGLSTLAAASCEEMATMEEVIEPFLLREGLINRTPRGRVATEEAIKHLGLTKKGPNAQTT